MRINKNFYHKALKWQMVNELLNEARKLCGIPTIDEMDNPYLPKIIK